MQASIRKWIVVGLGILLLAAQVRGLGAQELSMALRSYTALNFIKDEGEWCCLAVTLVPYSKPRDTPGTYPSTGLKVLWRRAGPWVDPPLLLDATSDGEFLVVEIPPEYDDHGTWKLVEKRNLLVAYSDRGIVEKLKRKP